jgi:hypothetical protein
LASSAQFPLIPADTAQVARAVFDDRPNFYLSTGDRLNSLFSGLVLGNPGGSSRPLVRTVARLYLITIFQYKENLPDLLAVEALRERVDWKYALHLPLKPARLEAAQLCEFRRWLLADPGRARNLQALLGRLAAVLPAAEQEWLQVESCSLLEIVCQLNRLGKLWSSIRLALRTLAQADPAWLLATGLPHWPERYRHHRKTFTPAARSLVYEGSEQAFGSDGYYLLRKISESGNPALAELTEVILLRQMLEDQLRRVAWKVAWTGGSCADCP